MSSEITSGDLSFLTERLKTQFFIQYSTFLKSKGNVMIARMPRIQIWVVRLENCFPRDMAPPSGPSVYFQGWQGPRCIFTTLSWLKNPRNQNIPFTEHPGCGRLSCFNLLWLLSRKIPYVDHLLTHYVNRFIFNITAKNSLYLVPLLQDLMYSVVVICTFLRLQRPRTSLHP